MTVANQRDGGHSAACPRCGRAYPEGRLGLCPACLLDADIPPARLGDSLELLDEIGRGGMGTVWKARHLRLGRTVAVKFLAPELAAQPDFERRLEREARALALLSHPGIVAVHDYGREEGVGYIVMEYVEGAPLSSVIPLPVDRAVVIARRVLEALAYAHRRGVVHRDVKPENILVDAAGAVKVTDFGIARLVSGDADPGITAVGRVAGTPRYLAPEALAGAAPHLAQHDADGVDVHARIGGGAGRGGRGGDAARTRSHRVQGDRRPARGPLPGCGRDGARAGAVRRG